VGTGEIAEVADADEASGQDMLAKAAQKLGCSESHDALLVAVGIVSPSEGHVMTIEAEQTLVADGDAVCVTAKVAKHALGLPKSGLGIDDPVLAKQAAYEGEVQAGKLMVWDSLEEIEELATEHAAEDLHREKKGMSGVNPVGAGWVKTTGRNDAVEMRM